MADISINPVTRRTQYTGNTGLGPFSFNFNILQNTDIVVYKNSTLLTLTTDYTVTINANGTGSVTLTGSGNGTALVLADLLTIVGGRELSRTTDFVTAGDLLASSLNEQLDSNVIMVQQLDERFDRAMKLNIADEDGDLTLPLKSSRAGKTLAFDSSGNPVVGEDIGNWRGDWVSGTTYTVRDLVKDGSNENVYRVNTAHTSSGSTPLSSNANSAYYDLVVDAESAATSASNAASSASAAASSASAASTSASNAATSATNASNSASAASTSASNAATSETNASNSATSAATQASNAATSATNAATSASNASTSETNAASSASSASTSATSAATSASSAATSATNAGTSAGNASTSETNAANSASAAATSASNAATSESNAATSATNSANSATASANSATSAAASAASAAASYDYFDDRYLGTKASDPTVDNDGDPLVAGALYFNSTANEMRVYDGANWIPASSAGSVSFLTYNYTATSGQTTFSGSDDNAASLSYSVGNLMVTVNGVVLEDGTDYTATSGTSVVLATGAVLNDEVNIYAFKSFTTADMVPASTGGTFTGNVTFSNAATVNGAFTSIGIDDNATSTAITIDSSQNVGIASTNPLTTLQVGTTGISSISGAFSAHQAVDGDAVHYFFNSTQATASSTNETCQLYLGWRDAASGIAVAPRIVAGKEGDYTTAGGADSFLAFHTALDNTLGEKVRITSAGNVGIGTSSPAVKTHIAASSYTAPTGGLDPNIKLLINNTQYCGMQILGSSTGSSFIHFGDQDNADVGLITYEHNGDYMRFDVNASERMRIDSSGNLLVGTTSAVTGNSLATVSTGITASSSTSPALQLYCSGAGSNQKYWRWTSRTNGEIKLEQVNDAYTSPTERMRITSTGALFMTSLSYASASTDLNYNTSTGEIFVVTSSMRYKSNIADLDIDTSKVLALRPVSYTDNNSGMDAVGLIAEEVHEEIPQLVNYKEIEGYDEIQPDSVKYSTLSVYLLKVIQEQQTIIEDLKARIATLENA